MGGRTRQLGLLGFFQLLEIKRVGVLVSCLFLCHYQKRVGSRLRHNPDPSSLIFGINYKWAFLPISSLFTLFYITLFFFFF